MKKQFVALLMVLACALPGLRAEFNPDNFRLGTARIEQTASALAELGYTEPRRTAQSLEVKGIVLAFPPFGNDLKWWDEVYYHYNEEGVMDYMVLDFYGDSTSGIAAPDYNTMATQLKSWTKNITHDRQTTGGCVEEDYCARLFPEKVTLRRSRCKGKDKWSIQVILHLLTWEEWRADDPNGQG